MQNPQKPAGTTTPKLHAPLRAKNPQEIKNLAKAIKRHPLYLVLDNIYDTFNVGGFFRLADALAAKMLILVGGTSTPPDNKIRKASVNTVYAVEWQYFKTATQALRFLKRQEPNIQIVSAEITPNAVEYTQVPYKFPLALVFGNETTGVSPTWLKASHYIAKIPMYGVNHSLNVVVSAAVIGFYALGNSHCTLGSLL